MLTTAGTNLRSLLDARGRCGKRRYLQSSGKMAESEKPQEGSCTFLFKKSNRKFSGRKRKASDSDKGLLFASVSDHLIASELPVLAALLGSKTPSYRR